MSRENRRWLVADESVEFEKLPVEVQDFMKFTDFSKKKKKKNQTNKEKEEEEMYRFLEESIEYTSNEWKHENRKMSTCNRLDLESSLGSWPTIMPKNFPGTNLDD